MAKATQRDDFEGSGDNLTDRKPPCPTFDEALDPQWRGGEPCGYPLNPAGRATRKPQDRSEG